MLLDWDTIPRLIMKARFILFRRQGVDYAEDTTTRKQYSLRTKDESEAKVLLNAKNESFRQPVLNLQIARAYLTASDPAIATRTWQTVMDQMQTQGKDSSQERYVRAMKAKSFDALRDKRLLETNAADFLAVLNGAGVSVSHFLKWLHNFALGLVGLPCQYSHPNSGRSPKPNPSAPSPGTNTR